jgi:hypothetical protein
MPQGTDGCACVLWKKPTDEIYGIKELSMRIAEV